MPGRAVSRRLVISILWVSALLALPLAWGQGGRPGEFVIGSLEEPASLSALADLPHHFPEHVPQTLLFDSLVQFMPDGTVAPKLAQKWEASADGRTYTFTLVPSARFHDGQPVTAADVKFTFEAALDPTTNSSDEGLDAVERIEAVDARTVRVTLKRFTPRFLAEAGARGIVPRHALAGRDLTKDEFNRKPVGSGPYRIVSFAPGQSIVMEAVPDFYRGPARIGRIIFKVLPDQNVVLTQLRAGEIHYALLAPRDLPAVASIKSVRVVAAPTPRFYDIVPNYQRAYWQDRRVREAVLVAIDREGLVRRVLQGHGRVMDANVAPTSWAYNPAVPKHPYDPGRTKALLDEAGWTAGADGIRGKDGQRLSIAVMINNFDATLEQVLVVAQQQLRQVGVDLRIERVEPGVFGARRREKRFDALSRVWNPVYDPDQTFLVRTGNFSGYSNPRVDELSGIALGTLDRETRRRAYAEIQDLLARDVARLFLYTQDELHAVPTGLRGTQPHPVNFFWNTKDWSLDR